MLGNSIIGLQLCQVSRKRSSYRTNFIQEKANLPQIMEDIQQMNHVFVNFFDKVYHPLYTINRRSNTSR